MSFQALPDDMLLGILQHVSSWTKNSRVDFKQQLYILGVFQRLRALALPKIYSHVYITCDIYNSRQDQNYANKYCKSFANYINTNADIIALANCTHMVKSVMLFVNGLSKTYIELYNTIEALKICATSWPDITKLEISIEHQIYSSNRSKAFTKLLCQMGIKYSQELAKTMPGIAELTLTISGNGNLVREFYSQLAGTYSDQLVKLSNGFDFYLANCYTLKIMQHLYINMGYNYTLPRINSHTLVDMHIDRIPSNVSWAPFLNNKEDTVVEFSCLKKLRLGFINNEAAERANIIMPELLLKFPKLSSLTIVCYTKVCPFFNMATFPDVMDNISIKAPPMLLERLKDAGIPTAKKVIMCS